MDFTYLELYTTIHMNKEERRKSFRTNCNINVGVSGDDKEIRAESLDISETGFKLRSYRRFALNSRYELTFTLNPELTNIKCVATVAWINKVDDPDIFLTGFTFSELSQDDLLKIQRFVEEKGDSEEV